ncbi:Enterokinase catalytic light chain [Fasciola gigantica]|uniref:Enterokinase catalytic light chain n=1 Tax=Fasciola gigantica TaxID=46835 RepID=A0A504YPB8_FASGI|nr:Enterokinase catalytic light chain [Fasciola gigantica]
MDCVYEIQVPTGQEIDIQILDIDIEETNECMFDFVSVGELNSSFPYRFCGCQKPKFPIRVRNSVARVHFVSDSGQGGRGFLMAFQSVLSNKNDVDKCACGVAPQVNDQNTTRILGGSSVVSGQWPWMASLWYDRRFVCGASLVASQWLLTAAHCLPFFRLTSRGKEVDLWNAVLGDLLLDWPDSGEQIVRMTKVKIHPMYNVGARYDYDLALIKLAEAAQLGPSVRPICLLRGEKLLSTLTTLEFTTACYVAGWGRSETQAVTNELRHLRMPLLNVTACNETDAYRGLLTSSMLCAGHPSGGHDSCKGDSGGPLMCQIGSTGTWYQIGVVSFGKQCARK